VRKPVFCSAAEAVADIQDRQTVACVGVIGWITPDLVLAALGKRFETSQQPCGLTFYFPCGTGDAVGIPGMDHVAQEGLMKRIVSGSFINPVNPATGARPRLMRLVKENKIEAYAWPIGASMQWLREVARKSPGYLTRVGLGTYIDPQHSGGRMTECSTEDLVERVQFRGEDLLFYPTWKLDVGIIRATSADEFGNLSFEDEPIMSSNLHIALAVKACGGRVIAQVKRKVPSGQRAALEVRIPGNLIDQVVVDPDQMMVTDIPFDPAYLGPNRTSLGQLPRLPMGPDKVIARRAAMAIPKDELCIFGFGASSDVPLVMAEQGDFEGEKLHDYLFTTEHGSHGGIVMSGWQFSANVNPTALLDGVTQFDLIDGGLCTVAALAFAQLDAEGNVNVSRFGNANPGAGGFIDIAENAKTLLFCGGFTTAGLKTNFPDGCLKIEQEGRVRKFVKQAEHLTYPVLKGVRERGQKALVITERAVFEITAEGYVLKEIAPGVDLKIQVLDQMDFAPIHIPDPLPRMDTTLFRTDAG